MDFTDVLHRRRMVRTTEMPTPQASIAALTAAARTRVRLGTLGS